MGILHDNPVLRRETRSRLRHVKRSADAQRWAAIVLIIIIAVCYGVVFRESARARIQGDELWMAGMWLQLVVGLAVLPAVTATAICVERQQGSLELLLATPMSNAEIVLGKYLARMTIAVMMLAAGLPFEIVAVLRGGLDPGLAIASAIVLVVTLATAGAMALLCSAVFRIVATAVGAAYAAVASWLALPPLAAAILPGWLHWSWGVQRWVANALAALSPVASMAFLPGALSNHTHGYGRSSMEYVPEAILVGTVVAIGMTAIALFLTVSRLRRG